MSTSLVIPEELIEQFERGNIVPLLGAGLAEGGNGERGLPTNSELAQELARRSDYGESNLTLSRVAQYYELKQERHALISFLRERLIDLQVGPLTVHRLLATLSWRFVITTSLDNLFEKALSDARHPYMSIIGNTDVAFQDQEKLLLVRMYGTLDQPDSVVVTELDYLRWQHQIENFMILLHGLIASRTLLILGHDLEDEHIRNLYGRVILPLKRNVRRSYALDLNISGYTKALWEELNVEIIPSTPAVFLEQVLEQLHARQGLPKAQKGSQSLNLAVPIPKQPYKFLNSFEESDSSIFFGRDREKALVLSKIVSFRLILLHGKSGTGKSSLIKAGLMPDLRSRGYGVVYARILINPIESIEIAFNDTLESPLPQDISLHAFLIRALDGTQETRILFLDQFEELFTDQFDVAKRLELLNALGEVYADTSLDLNIVISIREDSLAQLSVLKGQIPEIFYNDYHLEQLKPDQAREAIVNPVEPYGIRYEEGLVDKILEDLGGENVDPPQLQIVCDHLYTEREYQHKVITFAQYDHLGGARAILAAYLDDVLKQYPGVVRLKLQAVLKEFITSGAHPTVPTKEELTKRTGLPLGEVQQVLDELIGIRLIRELPPEPHFELVHEYLIPQISSWSNEEDRAQKRAQEMLDQGFIRWQNFHLPLYADELMIIHQQRDKLRLNDETRSLLIYSSVWTGSDPDYWLQDATAEQRHQAIKAALEDSKFDRRIRAIMLAGRFYITELIPVLKQIVEEDVDVNVRRQAINGLFQLQGVEIVSWLTTLLNGSPQQQQHALEAIDELQQSNDWSLDTVQDLSRFRLRMRIRLLRWQQNHGLWQFVTVYAALGGAVGGSIGGSLAAILSNNLSSFVVSTVLGTTFGFLAGTGVGFGYGTILATREPRRSLLYVLGAALGGSLIGLLGASADLLPEKTYWSIRIGLLSGAATGAAIALLINLTSRVPGRTRFILRLVIGTVLGIVTTGFLLSFGTQVGAVGHPVVPLQPLGASLVGAFTVTGIAVGLEFAERKLESPHAVRSVFQAT
jgi:hypothetical protein